MNLRLFINTNEVDLYGKESIGYTKQVNSLRDISKRDSSYTKSFKVPRTAKNVEFFKGLGSLGSTSPMPYQKNTARLFAGNICIIFKGWTLFEGTLEEDFEIYIYDGHIDFMKQLDNKTFDDIDLPEIAHIKEVPVIKSNWELGNEFFKYLLADFNGETHFLNGGIKYINADYLVPSVPVKYLWERIFQTFGFTFSGTIFQDEEFLNLLLTYPKGVIAGEDGQSVFSFSFPDQTIKFYSIGYTWSIFRPDFYPDLVTVVNSGEIIDNTTQDTVKHWKCGEIGYYRIRITGSLTNKYTVPSYLYLGKNLQDTHLYDNDNNMDLLTSLVGGPIAVAQNETTTIDIDVVTESPLFQDDTLSFYYWIDRNYEDLSTLNLEFEIIKINQTSIDQIEFFKNLSPKDFYKEVMWRFGLTPFPSKDENHIEFLTYDERINGETLDWSDKFIRKISEKYVYDGYAKANHFRFKYNGEGDEFNDGRINIENENLEEKVDVIKSKTYSPEKLPVPFDVGGTLEQIPKLELWEKEPTEENDQVVIKYNPRDSRFSFVRERVIARSANLGSKQLMVYDSVTQVRAVEHYNYSWNKIIENRYKPIRTLFKNTKIVKAEFHLSQTEFDAFDLKPTIYVEQMGGEFLVDKISKSDLNKKTTIVELIKINR